MMNHLSYELTDMSAKTRLGVIVLSTDECLEGEFRRALSGQDVDLLHARIQAEAEVTPETLATMASRMTSTAALLPTGLDAIAYACTSGATVIGEDRVAALIQKAHRNIPVTNPLTAVRAALQALDVRRIALVSPYVASVTAPLRAALEQSKTEIVSEASFGESHDQTVARISEGSTLAAIRQVTGKTPVDAVFASCTNLHSFSLIEQAETELSVPVISSNSALLWHLGRLAGTRLNGPGRLFEVT